MRLKHSSSSLALPVALWGMTSGRTLQAMRQGMKQTETMRGIMLWGWGVIVVTALQCRDESLWVADRNKCKAAFEGAAGGASMAAGKFIMVTLKNQNPLLAEAVSQAPAALRHLNLQPHHC